MRDTIGIATFGALLAVITQLGAGAMNPGDRDVLGWQALALLALLACCTMYRKKEPHEKDAPVDP